jgi:uncharacterized protein
LPVYYLDASAAVKAYSEERGADRVEEILEHGTEIHMSRVCVVEVAAAFFGKTKTDEMRMEEAVVALEEFRLDVENIYRIAEIRPVTTDRAIELAKRHRLRAYDCLQLATALLLQEQRVPFELAPLVLVSSDGELNAAAEGEGLNVEDPAE